MKMKKGLTRMISVLVLAAMCLSGTSVFAVYDVDHSAIVGGTDTSTFTSASSTDYTDRAVYAAGKFTIGGKDFVLLDKDSDGNYFVTSADMYGRYKYYEDDGDTTFGAKQTLVTATQEEDSTWTIDDSTAKTFISDQKITDWMYSTTNEKSIGYWLNNGFLTDGNTTAGVNYKLPAEIQSHLVSKTWDVESIKPLRNVKTNDVTPVIEAASDVMKLADLRGLTMDGYTTAPAKVSLLSYSEYVEYWEKLGYSELPSDAATGGGIWQNGILFRTPALRVENAATGYVMSRGVAGIVGLDRSTANTRSQLGILAFRTNTTSKFYYVRPVFWLDKDFFVKEEANISKDAAATEIIDEIAAAKAALSAEFASNPYAVRRRYTDEQLETLGLLTLDDEGYQKVGYPTSSSLAPFAGKYYNSKDGRQTWKLDSPTSKQTPNDAYAFEFGGKKFLVLDDDGKGNYFVSAYDSYGKVNDLAYTNKTSLTSAASAEDISFVFDYNNEGSIAYWLDNTFKEKLPAEIAANIKTHSWEIEGIAACAEATTGVADEGMRAVVEAYRNADLGSKAKTTGGVALISLTEYMKYRNILGHIDTSKAQSTNLWTYDVLMRTPMVLVEGSSEAGYTCTPGVFVYNRNAFDDSSDKTTKIARSKQAAHINNQLRPVFWLKGDFFKSNKIDLTKAGSEVIEILATMSESEATAAGYSANEYKALQGTIPGGVAVTTNLESDDMTGVTSITATLNNAISVSKDVNALAIIAVYNDSNALIDVVMKEITLPKNSATTTLELTKGIGVTYDNKTYGRVFVWSSFKDIVPYDEATPFGAK